MTQRKHIRVRCPSSEIFAPSDDPCQWEDFFVTWKERPGRRPLEHIATVISRRDLESHIEAARKLGGDFRDDLAHSEAVLSTTAKDGRFYEILDDDDPDIYIDQPFLTRVNVEAALEFWLEREHGLRDVKFDWER